MIWCLIVNALWPNDTIWRQRSESSQHWIWWWLVAWQHQAITWTNVHCSSVKSSDINIRAISQEMPQPSTTKIHLKMTYLKFHSRFSGGNELIVRQWHWFVWFGSIFKRLGSLFMITMMTSRHGKDLRTTELCGWNSQWTLTKRPAMRRFDFVLVYLSRRTAEQTVEILVMFQLRPEDSASFQMWHF